MNDRHDVQRAYRCSRPVVPAGTFLAILLTVALVGCASSPTAPTIGERNRSNANEQRTRTLTEAVMLQGPPLCSPNCMGLTAWNDLIPDGLLRRAAIVGYTYYPDLRPLAQKAAARGTRVTWGNLPADVGGNYDGGKNLITISNSLAI